MPLLKSCPLKWSSPEGPISKGEAFRMRHEVPRVEKKKTRDETDHDRRHSLDLDRSIPVTETKVEFGDL